MADEHVTLEAVCSNCRRKLQARVRRAVAQKDVRGTCPGCKSPIMLRGLESRAREVGDAFERIARNARPAQTFEDIMRRMGW